MKHGSIGAAVAALATVLAGGAACAQDNVFKFGAIRYTTHSSSTGLSTTPPIFATPADAETGDATTAIFVYERSLTPNIGAEFVIGIPPRIKAKGTGAAAVLGDEVLSAKNVSPTFLVNYYFGAPDARLRPYLGAGLNYTRFVGIRSSLPTSKLQMSDSVGWALQGGLSYSLSQQWGLFATITRLDTKTDVEAVATVPGVPIPVAVKTTIDLRPVTYAMGVWYRF